MGGPFLKRRTPSGKVCCFNLSLYPIFLGPGVTYSTPRGSHMTEVWFYFPGQIQDLTSSREGPFLDGSKLGSVELGRASPSENEGSQ